jgi:hypothetical protein
MSKLIAVVFTLFSANAMASSVCAVFIAEIKKSDTETVLMQHGYSCKSDEAPIINTPKAMTEYPDLTTAILENTYVTAKEGWTFNAATKVKYGYDLVYTKK